MLFVVGLDERVLSVFFLSLLGRFSSRIDVPRKFISYRFGDVGIVPIRLRRNEKNNFEPVSPKNGVGLVSSHNLQRVVLNR